MCAWLPRGPTGAIAICSDAKCAAKLARYLVTEVPVTMSAVIGDADGLSTEAARELGRPELPRPFLQPTSAQSNELPLSAAPRQEQSWNDMTQDEFLLEDARAREVERREADLLDNLQGASDLLDRARQWLNQSNLSGHPGVRHFLREVDDAQMRIARCRTPHEPNVEFQ